VRDDGYHLLDAEVLALDLADELRFTTPGEGLTMTGQFADGVPVDGTNLVARALAAVGRSAAVDVVKKIPHGSGLGGGSADAAAVLRWAGVSDLALAATLGADVPCCLVGGRVRMRGVGELIDPLPFEPVVVTLVVPPLLVSTPAVYQAWDDLGGPQGEGVNDLEPAALVVEPQLRAWRDRIGEAAGVVPVLAGSGSAWFVDGDRADVLERLRDDGAFVRVARAVRPGWARRRLQALRRPHHERPSTTSSVGDGSAAASSCASSCACACGAS
jgi:4-diphosphocytidyl-2-C-methyl-D-erythritol kinase